MIDIPKPTCELDQWVLDEIARRQRSGEAVTVMNTGVGADLQALRMAAAGCRVLLISDQTPQENPNIEHLPTVGLADSDDPLPLEPFDIILCQRTLGAVSYAEARNRLRRLLRRLKIGGKLFVSLYGIHSELSDGYPDGAKLVNDRLAPLAPEIAERYGLAMPLCLYSERNLFSLLMEAGGAILKTSTSALGHVRGVAARI